MPSAKEITALLFCPSPQLCSDWAAGEQEGNSLGPLQGDGALQIKFRAFIVLRDGTL